MTENVNGANSNLNPTPIINIAIKALELPIISAKEITGVSVNLHLDVICLAEMVLTCGQQ